MSFIEIISRFFVMSTTIKVNNNIKRKKEKLALLVFATVVK